MRVPVMAGLDTSIAYAVAGYPGVAFRLIDAPRGFAAEDGEYETDEETVTAVMIGDDRRHTLAVADLTPLDDDAWCRSCGQVGCTHDGRN